MLGCMRSPSHYTVHNTQFVTNLSSGLGAKRGEVCTLSGPSSLEGLQQTRKESLGDEDKGVLTA